MRSETITYQNKAAYYQAPKWILRFLLIHYEKVKSWETEIISII